MTEAVAIPNAVTHQASDPFNERSASAQFRIKDVLGAQVRFDSESPELLALVEEAYGGLVADPLPATAPRLRVRLILSCDGHATNPAVAPALAMLGAGSMVGSAAAGSSFAIVSPHDLTALVVVSRRLLPFAYHVRYEFIEFAVCSLAARAMQLVPLHGACIGRAGRALLLMGESGSGKSTLTLQAALQGFEVVAEDGVFVGAASLMATGVANFLHLRAASLPWVCGEREAELIRRSPIIERRSGVRKFEVDLRRSGWRSARSALQVSALVFLSPANAGGAPLLRRLDPEELPAELTAHQAYAGGRPEWPEFLAAVAQRPAFRLYRGHHPRDAVDALHALLPPV